MVTIYLKIFNFSLIDFFVENLQKFIYQMGNPRGVYDTNYKVIQAKNHYWGEIWPLLDLLWRQVNISQVHISHFKKWEKLTLLILTDYFGFLLKREKLTKIIN